MAVCFCHADQRVPSPITRYRIPDARLTMANNDPVLAIFLPRLPCLLVKRNALRLVEVDMKFGLALFTRWGLYTHKGDANDARFDQRLQRIGAREMRRAVQAGLFRNPRGRLAI
jgi:hypothetical protein